MEKERGRPTPGDIEQARGIEEWAKRCTDAARAGGPAHPPGRPGEVFRLDPSGWVPVGFISQGVRFEAGRTYSYRGTPITAGPLAGSEPGGDGLGWWPEGDDIYRGQDGNRINGEPATLRLVDSTDEDSDWAQVAEIYRGRHPSQCGRTAQSVGPQSFAEWAERYADAWDQFDRYAQSGVDRAAARRWLDERLAGPSVRGARWRSVWQSVRAAVLVTVRGPEWVEVRLAVGAAARAELTVARRAVGRVEDGARRLACRATRPRAARSAVRAAWRWRWIAWAARPRPFWKPRTDHTARKW